MKPYVQNKEYLRMFHWLAFSLLAYAIAAFLHTLGNPALPGVDAGMLPRVQTVLWKCGHLNLAAFIGYWVDRHSSRDRLTLDSPPHAHIRRAIIMGMAMVAFSIAL